MNINSVGNSWNCSGTRKPGNEVSKTGSFASELEAAEKKKISVNKNSLTDSVPKVNGLSDDDYKYLSSNWNPNHMSQKEYDEFLDFLQSKGILSEEDKSYICYGGEVRIDSLEPESWYSPNEPVHDFADGNALAFVRYRSSLIYDHQTTETKREVDLYKKITLIMEKMVKRTGNS